MWDLGFDWWWILWVLELGLGFQSETIAGVRRSQVGRVKDSHRDSQLR